MRAHYYRPFTDNAGNLLSGVQITLYAPGTTTLIAGPIYSDGTSGNTLNNPWVSANGIIDFYLAAPQRVDINVVQGNAPASVIHDQDVISTGSDSPHIGVGANSTVVGLNASSAGSNSTAVGNTANGAGNQATVYGANSTAVGNQSTVVGAGAQVNGVGGTALGYNSSIGTGINSTALGNAAVSNNNNSTAVGAGATTNDDNQIMLGTNTQYVMIPNYMVVLAPNNTKWKITVDNNGNLTTTQM